MSIWECILLILENSGKYAAIRLAQEVHIMSRLIDFMNENKENSP